MYMVGFMRSAIYKATEPGVMEKSWVEDTLAGDAFGHVNFENAEDKPAKNDNSPKETLDYCNLSSPGEKVRDRGKDSWAESHKDAANESPPGENTHTSEETKSQETESRRDRKDSWPFPPDFFYKLSPYIVSPLTLGQMITLSLLWTCLGMCSIRVSSYFVVDNQSALHSPGSNMSRTDVVKMATHGKTEFQNQPVSGLVAYQDLLFVVHSGHDEVYVYDVDGDLKLSHIVPKMRDPVDMAMVEKDGDTQLVIADGGEAQRRGRLHWVPIMVRGRGCRVGRTTTQHLTYWPYAVHSDIFGHTVVVAGLVYSVEADGKYVLHHYSWQRSEQWKLVLPYNVYAYGLTLATKAGSYVVCDWPHAQLVWIEQDGTLIRKVNAGSIHSELVKPRYITTDSKRNFILVDTGSNYVMLLSEEGNFMKHLLKNEDGVIKPRRVALNEEGNLLHVAHDGDKHYEIVTVNYEALVTSAALRLDSFGMMPSFVMVVFCFAAIFEYYSTKLQY